MLMVTKKRDNKTMTPVHNTYICLTKYASLNDYIAGPKSEKVIKHYKS